MKKIADCCLEFFSLVVELQVTVICLLLLNTILYLIRGRQIKLVIFKNYTAGCMKRVFKQIVYNSDINKS